MYTIAIVNEKGGTGKTTTAVNLSAALGHLQHQVLLVDLDGQAASSRWLGVEEDTSFADALYSGRGLQPLGGVMPNVSLAPASGKLDAVAHDLRPTQGGQLRKLLTEVSDRFEFVIIDCPPSLGNRLIGNALIAATHAVVPVETSILALDGLKILLTTLDDVREGFGHDIVLAGVLACRFDSRTRLSRMILAELKRALPGRVFETVIRENVRMRECPASGQSILTYAPDSHAAEDYTALARELLASPWLSCRPQDQSDAGGTAAFFAADKEERIGDSLRKSVRGATRESSGLEAEDSASIRKRLEEAQRRLAAEQGQASAQGPDGAPEAADTPEPVPSAAEAAVEVPNPAEEAAFVQVPTGQDVSAWPEQVLEPVSEPVSITPSEPPVAEPPGEAAPPPIEVIEPHPSSEEPVAVSVVADARPPQEPESPPPTEGETPQPAIWIDPAAATSVPAPASPSEAPAANPAGEGWLNTKMDPDAVAPPAPDTGWDKPVTDLELEPVAAVQTTVKTDPPAPEPSASTENWLDLITNAPQPDAPPLRPGQTPTQPPVQDGAGDTWGGEAPAEDAKEADADCPHLRQYLERIQKEQGQAQTPSEPSKTLPPKKGLLGRFFSRSAR